MDEARAFDDWLLRAVAGDPTRTKIMYGVTGNRRLNEFEVPWLPGYEGSKPVRVGNAAHEQFQLDVYGEVCDALHQSRLAGLQPEESAWKLERALVGFVAAAWREPDEGIWEVRGPRQHFTHSKVMAWVALDRAIKSAERFELDAPLRSGGACGKRSTTGSARTDLTRNSTRSPRRSGRSCSTRAS